MTFVARRGRTRVGALAVVVVAGLFSSCSDDPVDELPAPPTTIALASTTTGPDFSNVGLAAAGGRTTTTIAISPGAATLSGTVAAPDGAVPGATVRVERIVGDAIASVDVASNPDGTWSAPGIRGGRYRVRAWRAPDLALTKPQLLFLESAETRALNLRLNKYEGITVTSDIAPNPPEVNAPANLVILVAVRSVDTTGTVRANPIPGARVELFGGGWRLDSTNSSSTDANGQAAWQLRCRGEGRQPLSVSVNGESNHALELPDCTPSTAPPPTSSTSTTFLRPTSTTRRGTTSTTA